jgi:putative transcriptional regulator
MTAALAEPDAQPLTEEQLSCMRRAVSIRALREGLGLSQEAFARRFGLSVYDVRDWEERVSIPGPAARTLLRVIEREPEAVARALERA